MRKDRIGTMIGADAIRPNYRKDQVGTYCIRLDLILPFRWNSLLFSALNSILSVHLNAFFLHPKQLVRSSGDIWVLSLVKSTNSAILRVTKYGNRIIMITLLEINGLITESRNISSIIQGFGIKKVVDRNDDIRNLNRGSSWGKN